MSFEEFDKIEHPFGWKVEYWDGQAVLTPRDIHVKTKLSLTKRSLSHHFKLKQTNPNLKRQMIEAFYEAFEDSKFILTQRGSADKWYQSLCKHSLATGPTEYRKLIYGHYMPHDFKKEHIDFYNKHNSEVINFFDRHAPDKLLVSYNVNSFKFWDQIEDHPHLYRPRFFWISWK